MTLAKEADEDDRRQLEAEGSRARVMHRELSTGVRNNTLGHVDCLHVPNARYRAPRTVVVDLREREPPQAFVHT